MKTESKEDKELFEELQEMIRNLDKGFAGKEAVLMCWGQGTMERIEHAMEYWMRDSKSFKGHDTVHSDTLIIEVGGRKIIVVNGFTITTAYKGMQMFHTGDLRMTAPTHPEFANGTCWIKDVVNMETTVHLPRMNWIQKKIVKWFGVPIQKKYDYIIEFCAIDRFNSNVIFNPNDMILLKDHMWVITNQVKSHKSKEECYRAVMTTMAATTNIYKENDFTANPAFVISSPFPENALGLQGAPPNRESRAKGTEAIKS